MNLPSTLLSCRRAGLAAAVALLSPSLAIAGWIPTDTGTYEYNDPTNWTDGVIDDLFPATLTLTGAQTATFNDDRTTGAAGLRILYGGNFGLTLRGTGANRTLTLGGDVTVDLPGGTLTAILGSTAANQNLNVDLGGQVRNFSVSGAPFAIDSLRVLNTISNGGLVKTGFGNMSLEGVNVYAGWSTVRGGSLTLGGGSTTGGTALNSAGFKVQTIDAYGITGEDLNRLVLENNGSVANANRIGDTATVSLNSGAILLNNKSNANVNEVVGAFVLQGGSNQVSLTANGTGTPTLTGTTFTRNNQAVLRVSGANLGTSTFLKFTDANNVIASQIGGGGVAGSTTISITPWAIGAGTDRFKRSATGFVTYESASGFRTLDINSEYVQSIAGSANAADNVRITAGEAVNANKTINALLMDVTNGAAQVVSGSGELTVTSGAIYLKANRAGSGGNHGISVSSLNFAGNEAVIGVSPLASGESVMLISSAISNTGGKGLTKYGGGELILSGNNSYTGDTVVNEGILRTSSTGITSTSAVRVSSLGTLVVSNDASSRIAELSGSGVVYLDNTTARLNVGGATGSAGRITINTGASLSPGDIMGDTVTGKLTLGKVGEATNLSLLSGANMNIQLLSLTDFDSIVLASGNAILGGNLNISLLDGFTVAEGAQFTIMTTTGGISGSFDFVTAGFEASIVGNNLVITAVPEPATMALLAGGLASLLFFRRRK